MTQKEADKKSRDSLFGKGKTASERWAGLKDISTKDVYDGNGNKVGKSFSPLKLIDNLTHALGDMAKQLDSQIDKIGGYKSAIDTRLQGLTGANNN